MKAIGIDIGGTEIKAGIITEKGKILKEIIIETESSCGKNKLIENIKMIIKKLDSKEIKGIGIGFAGDVDAKKGQIIQSPNIPCMNNVFLVKELKKKTRKRIVLQNDATLMTLAEALIGNAKKFNVVVGLTAGTGIGSGITINKKIYSGKNNLTEIGHTVINFNGPQCPCGNYGCLEQYVGIKPLMRLTEIRLESFPSKLKKMWPLTPEKVDQAAKKKDKVAVSVLKQTGTYLGIGLTNIVNLLNPDAIVLGGGLSNSGILIKEAIKEMKKRVFKRAKNTKIIKAKFGKKAGIIGAALFAFK
jgi:glucokinase